MYLKYTVNHFNPVQLTYVTFPKASRKLELKQHYVTYKVIL